VQGEEKERCELHHGSQECVHTQRALRLYQPVKLIYSQDTNQQKQTAECVFVPQNTAHNAGYKDNTTQGSFDQFFHI
jgi:hypothetical protein